MCCNQKHPFLDQLEKSIEGLFKDHLSGAKEEYARWFKDTTYCAIADLVVAKFGKKLFLALQEQHKI